MLPMQKLFMTLLGLNLFGCFVFYLASLHHQDSSLSDFSLSTTQDFYTQTEPNPLETLEELRNKVLEVPLSAQKVSTPQEFFTMPPFTDPYSPDQSFTRQTNPFHKLGAYPEEIKIKLPYQDKYEQPLASVNYGIENEDDYCERVDYYNLANTPNIFEDLNFFSDFADNTITRHVITKIGEDTQPNVHNYNVTAESSEKQYTLDVTINTFFTHIEDFHRYHKIGKNFLCATQMYNHIPGSQALVKKDAFLKTLNSWIDKHSPRPFCFNGETYFLKTYRLSIQEECDSFFNRIKSKRYQKQLGSEPIQYIIKSTDETGSTDGVYLLDQDTTSWLFSEFNYGIKCGSVNTSLVAENYITNPLLLNMTNKFDFRVYMLIASTNPLIVYSHDGFLKASVSPYDKFSTDREKHLTSTRLANEIFMKAREQSTYNGKTEQQLRDAHILKFEDLPKYLLETGKITDKDWLENYLRPQFKKVMIHLAKMASPFYLKQSNVYGLYELEFMLDDNLNLWFIEANANPELVATNKVQGEIMNNMLRSLFEIEYGLYRSRMKRAFSLIIKLRDDNLMGYEPVNYNEYKGEYLKEIRNRFEPEFLMSQLNTFSLVMDESLPGQDAYQNYLDILCVFAH